MCSIKWKVSRHLDGKVPTFESSKLERLQFQTCVKWNDHPPLLPPKCRMLKSITAAYLNTLLRFWYRLAVRELKEKEKPNSCHAFQSALEYVNG